MCLNVGVVFDGCRLYLFVRFVGSCGFGLCLRVAAAWLVVGTCLLWV